MFQRILVAIDGTNASKNALYVAVDEAKAHRAELHAVYAFHHVVTHTMIFDGGSPLPDGTPEILNSVLDEEAKRILMNAREVASDEGISIIAHTVSGDARNVILDLSKEIKADLIIVGSSNKSGLDRLLLGSVSSAVVEHSKITTMVVREYASPEERI